MKVREQPRVMLQSPHGALTAVTGRPPYGAERSAAACRVAEPARYRSRRGMSCVFEAHEQLGTGETRES